ncbi:MAG TPA: DUF427 domain-containing protein [Solirubrobacteraceae bacterium]|nr:DUF427 domain-containing protein [Solirubrobacteraceae bacterium]
MREQLRKLRYEPTEKRLRAQLDGQPAIDTTHALLVWEPRRVVPSFAVPVTDVAGELVPADGGDESDSEVLHPGISFAAHSTPGDAFDIRIGGRTLTQAAFAPTDEDFDGYVIVDFSAFDGWLEEDEPLLGHPRDPFHRIDIRHSSRHVVVEHDGRVLADTTRPTLLFETSLPTRFYLPREDVVAELVPSGRRTICAYKGEANYFSVDGLDLVWTYEDPLLDAGPIKDLVCFFDELVDVTVDGHKRARPLTKFSKAIVEEAGVT